MSTTDFEQNDGLDGLSSEELEERAFGPDPRRKARAWRGRRRSARKKEGTPKALVPARRAPKERADDAPLVVVTKFCYACGAEVDARAEVCPRCGVRQPEAPRAGIARRRAKSKGGAALLALFLGGVGAHRFYLGQTKVGLAMLLFCWTLLPALVGVVDYFRYLFMSDRRFADLYEGAAPAPLVPPARALGRARPVRLAAGDAPAEPARS